MTLEEASVIAKRDVRESQGKVPAMQKERPLDRGGKLNPQWVEWLMGFPIGWTDLDV